MRRIRWDCCVVREFDTLNGTMPPDTSNRTWPTARLTRRDLLRAGVAGGLGLPALLHADSGVSAKAPKSCIFIHQYGGLSQLDSWDPKPGATQEVRGPYKPIATDTPGIFVSEIMPQLAQVSDDYAIIRSMTHRVPVHDVANRMMLAGQSLPDRDAPAFGSIVTKLKPVEAAVPPYVWLQKFGGGAMPPEASYLTGGFLGMEHAPVLIGATQDDHPATAGFRVRAFDPVEGVSASRLQSRQSLLSEMNAALASPQQRDRYAGFGAYQSKAFDLLQGPAARKAFDIDQETAETRDRYGRNPLGQNLLMARRLIESGVRLVSVVAWTGLDPGEKFVSVETWDMHGNAGVSIFGNGWNGLGGAMPKCDQGVAMLIRDLKDRGLLDSTLVVLVGEFGRTPRISQGAGAIGRDHWPNCYSAMVAGGGIRGGQVYGSSDSQAAYVANRPVTLEDFTATMLHTLGIDPATRLSPDGFSRPASMGEVVHELLA